jgi:membrane associated rhomboid family serine protease
MIPLSDGIPARRFPFVNVALIVANFAVWIFYELPHLDSSVAHASFYPCAVDGSCHGPESWGVSWFTAMFMHGGWDHILGNMLFLAIFGKNVEDAFGHLRYLAFYVVGGFVATMTQTLITLLAGTAADGRVPVLGASGAIAAVLGAYFVLSAVARAHARAGLPGPDLGVGLPRRLVPLPARRGQLRPVLGERQRRRHGVLRARRRVPVRPVRRAARRRCDGARAGDRSVLSSRR